MKRIFEDTLSKVKQDYGYHAGDLGKSENYWKQSGGRGTGHFGTGTYFVGNPDEITTYNDDRKGGGKAPHHIVDFSSYHLYKPHGRSEANEAHFCLKLINEYLNTLIDGTEDEIKKYNALKKAIAFQSYGKREAYINNQEEFYNNLEYYLDIINYFIDEANKNYYQPQYKNVVDTIGISNIEDYDDLKNEPYYQDKINDFEFSVEDTLTKVFNDSYMINIPNYKNSLETAKEIRNRLHVMFGNAGDVDKALDKTIEYAKECLAKGGLRSQDAMKWDSLSTVFMKNLGYEGVDVRHIPEFDNVKYGSVIYDLKPNTIVESLDKFNVKNTSGYVTDDFVRFKNEIIKSKVPLRIYADMTYGFYFWSNALDSTHDDLMMNAYNQGLYLGAAFEWGDYLEAGTDFMILYIPSVYKDGFKIGSDGYVYSYECDFGTFYARKVGDLKKSGIRFLFKKALKESVILNDTDKLEIKKYNIDINKLKTTREERYKYLFDKITEKNNGQPFMDKRAFLYRSLSTQATYLTPYLSRNIIDYNGKVDKPVIPTIYLYRGTSERSFSKHYEKAAGLFFSTRRKLVTGWGNIEKYTLKSNANIYKGKETSSDSFCSENDFYDKEYPELNKYFGMYGDFKKLSDFPVLFQDEIKRKELNDKVVKIAGSQFCDYDVWSWCTQLVAKIELEKQGYDGVLWTEEDFGNLVQYQIWNLNKVKKVNSNISESIEAVNPDDDDVDDASMIATKEPYEAKDYLVNHKMVWKIAYYPESFLYVLIDPFNATHWDVSKQLEDNGWIEEIDEPFERWMFIPNECVSDILDSFGEYSTEDFKHFGTFKYKDGYLVNLELLPKDIEENSLMKAFGKVIEKGTLYNLLLKDKIIDESKEDIQRFVDKFGQETYDLFKKSSQRLKNHNISTDILYHVKNTDVKELKNILFNLETRQNTKNIKSSETSGKYRYLGEESGYLVYEPLDVMASINLGVGTGWCTAGRYGHYGDRKFKPSFEDAERHWNDYISKGIRLFYFLNNKNREGEYAVAVYPRVRDVSTQYGNYYIKKTNLAIFNAQDKLDYTVIKQLPLDLIDAKKVIEYNEYVIVNDCLLTMDKTTLIKPKEIRVKNIVVPNSVEKIVQYAFYNCASLESITIPSSVIDIGDYCFNGCQSLKTIYTQKGSFAEKYVKVHYPKIHVTYLTESLKESIDMNNNLKKFILLLNQNGLTYEVTKELYNDYKGNIIKNNKIIIKDYKFPKDNNPRLTVKSLLDYVNTLNESKQDLQKFHDWCLEYSKDLEQRYWKQVPRLKQSNYKDITWIMSHMSQDELEDYIKDYEKRLQIKK